MISAIGTQGEPRFMLHEGSVDAAVSLKFIKRLMDNAKMENAKKPVILTVDGHPIHKAKIVKNYVDSQAGKLKLFYLPSYSPCRNLDETVWTRVRHRVSRQPVKSASDIKRLALRALRSK